MSAPSGTVSFLFTDIEGSTHLWQHDEAAMRAALYRHDELLRKTVADHDGAVFSSMGDGLAAAFSSASAAVAAAVTAQQVLEAEIWPAATPIRVRMGIHTGEADARDGDYFGTTVNRTARLMSIGHGGQVLVSSATAELLGDRVALVDLGEHRLRDLDRPMHVFQVGEGAFVPLRSLDSFLGNLPLQVSSFVGRERQLARGMEALGSSRVVTVTGVGGVGKTRLALQLAAEVLPGFRDGAWLIELAPVRDPERVGDAVASLFGVSARAGQSVADALVEFLSSKQMLLVFDNCEHVLDAVAELVDRIERSCARVVVLATSREGLALDGEQLLALPSLATPDSHADLDAIGRADAVDLFVQRAQLVDGDFTVTAENASAVAQVCRRLDGVPLAIELAAARIQAMTPSELARGLDHRFDTLAGGRRRAVQRHQTLRAAIDWSYDLLSEPEQRLLGRLSVFAGGCTRESAEAVCGWDPMGPSTVFGSLSGLVARSLVVAQREGRDTRYRLLETIREYGEQRCAEHGETEALRARHGDHYLHLARTLLGEADGPGQIEALRRLEVEYDNLLAASGNAVDTGNLDLPLGLLTSDWGHAGMQFYMPRFPLDVLNLDGVTDHRLYPAALVTAAGLASRPGDVQATGAFCRAAVEAAERLGVCDPVLDWSLPSVLAGAVSVSGAYTEAAEAYERSADVARAAGLLTALAQSLVLTAFQHVLVGDRNRALPFANEGLGLARQLGRPDLLAQALGALSGALAEKDPRQAKALLQESVRLVATFTGVTRSLSQATAIFTAAGMRDWAQVLQLAASSITDYHWRGSRTLLGATLTVVSRAIVAVDPATSARLQGAGRRLMTPPRSNETQDTVQSTPTSPASPPTEASSGNAGLATDLYRQTTATLRDALGEAHLRELRAEGAAMDDDHVVALALDVIARAQPAGPSQAAPGSA